jgi:hypothetical protein
MKRTTIYFDGDLELRLKMEVQRRRRPMAELVREAVEAYLTKDPAPGPPGAGEFASGRADTANDVDAALRRTRFGAPKASRRPVAGARRRPARRRP